MKKKLLICFFVGLLALLSIGVLVSCNEYKPVDVPTPDIIGGDAENCEHEYDEGVFFEATCLVRAHTKHTCKKCNNSYVIYDGEFGPHVEATRHIAGKNCLSFGCTETYCTVCNNILSTEYDTEYGPHSYVNTNRKVAGDCKTIGYTVLKTCSVCKEQIIEEGTYGDHKLGKAVHVDPTCVSEGYDEATCTVCNQYKEKYNVVPPSDHDLKEVTVPGADCQHLTVILSRCLRCDYEKTTETSLYGPHAFASVDGDAHACSVCGTSSSHNVVIKSVSDAEHMSYCDVCGRRHETQTHSYGSPVTVDATCTQNGLSTYSCNVCGHTHSVVLPAKHDFRLSTVTLSSCDKNGDATIVCSSCGKTEKASFFAPSDSSAVGVAPVVSLLPGAPIGSGEYVYFGSYPSTRVVLPTITSVLNSLAGNLPTPSDNADWRLASYCGNSAYSWYIDVTHGGEKYRGLYFTAYRPALLSDQPGAERSYVDDNGYLAGTVYWFRYERLRWKVLSSDNGYILFSHAITDAQALGASLSSWDNCSLKGYLDEEFFTVAFSDEEKASVIATSLLSDSDLKNADYGFLGKNVYDEALCLQTTDYAKAQGALTGAFWLTPSSSTGTYALSSYGYALDRAPGHNFSETIDSSNLRSQATCVAYATYYKVCSVCGKLSEEYFSDEGNGYALHSYAYSYTPVLHKYACSVCGEELLEEGHTLTHTDEQNGLHHRSVCSVCGYNAREEHAFSESACSLCNVSKVSYTAYWDVSGGTYDVVAYLNGTTLTILGRGEMSDYSTQSLPPYSSYSRTITDVVFGENVTSIGAYAFYGFSALTSVTVPEQIEKIGKCAFAHAEKVSSLHFKAVSCGSFPANNNVFANLGANSASLSVVIGENVTTVPACFLYPSADALPSVTSLTIESECLTSIGDYAFYNLSLPTDVSLPDVRSIGDYAFYGNAAATSFMLGGELTSVGKYAFYQCENATFRTGSYFTSVGEYAFYNCRGLSSACLNVNIVPDYAFFNTGLDVLMLSEVPTFIGKYAFFNAPLTTVLNADLSSGNLLLSASYVGDCAFFQSQIGGDLSSDNLVSVGEKAFYGCRNLLSVSAPALSSIGIYAFAECSDLGGFFADGLTSVSDGCFAGDSDLRRLRFSSSLTDVGKESFLSCYRLNSFTLPATLSSIGTNAFKGCFTLVEVDNRSSLGIKEGAISNGYVTAYTKRIYDGRNDLSALTEENGLILLQTTDTSLIVGYDAPGNALDLSYDVADYAFYKASGIESVTVRNGKTVGRFAFYGAKDLTSVRLSGTASTEAFSSCENLSFVAIGAGSAIAIDAFSGDLLREIAFDSSLFTSLKELFSVVEAQTLRMTSYTEGSVPAIDGYSGVQETNEVVYTSTTEIETITANITPSVTYTLKKIRPNGYSLSINGTGTLPDFTENNVPWADYIDVIISLTFESGVTNIGAYALYGATSLSEVLSFGGVTNIGDYAFFGCAALSSCELPSGLTLVGKHAFENCSSLQTLSLPSSLTSIESYAFSGCSSLKNGAVLPEGVTSIGSHAYDGCVSLTEISLPYSITYLGGYAFADCHSLTRIVYNCEDCADLERDNYLFYNCGQSADGITLIIGDDVRSIPAYLFNPVFNLKYASPRILAVTVPHPLTVGDYAFRNVGASEIDLSLATSIGKGVLSGTTPEVLVLKELTTTFGYLFGGSNASVPAELKRVKFTSSASVPDNAFSGCAYLVSVTLPSGNENITIGQNAFYGCLSLSSISVSGDGISVGTSAFFGCSSLQSVSISSSDKNVTLGEHAFAECSALTEVSVNRLSSVGTGAFLKCKQVSSFSCTGQNVAVHQSGDAFGLYSLSSFATLIGFVGPATGYEIPGSVGGKTVSVIGEEAFASLDGLYEVTLPSTVTSVEEKAFFDCSSIKTVDFGDNEVMRAVGVQAFAKCANLRNIVLPASTQIVSERAFEDCSSLTSFLLPAETNTLGERAFASCRKLKTFSFGGKKLASLPTGAFSSCVLLSSIDLPQGMEIIGENAFEQCSSLLSVTLPTGLKQVRSYAFSHCKNLTALSIPNSVITLGDKVFNGCIGLEELQFGTGISSLGMGMLSGCKSLRSLTLPFVGATNAESKTIYPFGYIFGTASYDGSVKTPQSVIEVSTFGGETVYTSSSVTYYLPQALKTVTIRSGSINEGAFSGCSSLQTVDISATGVRKISKKAFSGCSQLTKIVFPDTLTTIEAEAFFYCSSLTDLLLPERVSDIDFDESAYVAKSAFTYSGYYSNQRNWEEGVFYLKVKRGSGYALFAADAQTGTDRPCHVKEGTILILDNAFENSSFTEVYLPSSVQRVGENVLKGNSRISVLSVPFVGKTPSENNFLAYFFGGKLDLTVADPEYKVNSSQDYIPSSLTSLILTGNGAVPDRVCHGCSHLASVVIGNGYTSVGTQSFAGCPILESVTLPDSMSVIGMYAFEYCTSLQSIILPNSVTNVRKGAFASCTAMRFYSAPFVGATPTGNTYLGYVFCPSSEESPSATMNGDLVPESLEIVSLSGNYSSVPAGAFYGCRYIRTVILNVNASTIGSDAFYNCALLSDVYIVGTGSYKATYRDSNTSRYEHFANASFHQIYFDSESVTRNLSTILQDNTYVNRLNSNDTSLTIESTKYVSSDPSVAAFQYEFDENGNGVIEATEKKDHSSDGLVTFFKKGTTVITVTVKTTYFTVSLSYTLTVS